MICMSKHVGVFLSSIFLLLQWTDDTSMALCIAESLIECQGYNSLDMVKRFYEWYQVRVRGGGGVE